MPCHIMLGKEVLFLYFQVLLCRKATLQLQLNVLPMMRKYIQFERHSRMRSE